MHTYQLNDAGMQQLRQFLANNLKLRPEVELDEVLGAWAQEAEQSLNAGNPAIVELKNWESLDGHTQTFEITDAGVDTFEIDETSGRAVNRQPYSRAAHLEALGR